jgi:hypothetical protein
MSGGARHRDIEAALEMVEEAERQVDDYAVLLDRRHSQAKPYY